MHCLQMPFKLFTYGGFWRPVDYKPNTAKYWLYNIFTCFAAFLVCSLAAFEIVLAALADNIGDSAETLAVALSVLGVIGKVANLLLRRDRIIGLGDMLLEERYLPQDEEEMSIKQKFDRSTRSNTIFCELLNQSSVFFFGSLPLVAGVENRLLPVKAWVPFDIQPVSNFAIAYLHHIVGIACCANASVANDTMISGFMILASGQFEILKYRVQRIPAILSNAQNAQKNMTAQECIKMEKKLVIKAIHHHLFIIRFAQLINEIFNQVIFAQCSVSSLVLCMTVYRSSQAHHGMEWLGIVSYLGSMLLQIFLLTWYGNEIILQSSSFSDTIYQMDWTILHGTTMKYLFIMMLRTSKPVTITSGYIVTLSNDVFTSLLKMSYSAYNMLQQSSKAAQ